MSSGSDTVSASISNPYTHSIKTESQFTDSRTPSILSQSPESDGFAPADDDQKKRKNAFLGYYECLINNNSSLISFSTARIDLHGMKVNEGKH
jgi:hypothetical protein